MSFDMLLCAVSQAVGVCSCHGAPYIPIHMHAFAFVSGCSVFSAPRETPDWRFGFKIKKRNDKQPRGETFFNAAFWCGHAVCTTVEMWADFIFLLS